MHRTLLPALAALLALLFLTTALPASSSAADDAAVCLPADWNFFRHMNSLVVPDKESPVHGFHHFYIGEIGRDQYLKRPIRGAFRTGTTLIGRVHVPIRNEQGIYNEGKLAAFTLMVKRPDLAETEDTGGWVFAKFDAAGQRQRIDPVKDCFHCHKPSPETDFVLSRPAW